MSSISEWYQRNQPHPSAKVFAKSYAASGAFSTPATLYAAAGRMLVIDRIQFGFIAALAWTGTLAFGSYAADDEPGIYNENGTTEWVLPASASGGAEALASMIDAAYSLPTTTGGTRYAAVVMLRPPMRVYANGEGAGFVITSSSFNVTAGTPLYITLRGWELSASDY
jgi:hypothetical protein